VYAECAHQQVSVHLSIKYTNIVFQCYYIYQTAIAERVV